LLNFLAFFRLNRYFFDDVGLPAVIYRIAAAGKICRPTPLLSTPAAARHALINATLDSAPPIPAKRINSMRKTIPNER
jgi:hypothetical protein